MDDVDILQLTAQSMCLEEMLLCHISEACLYYDEIKRQQTVPLTEEYRQRVRTVCREMHQLYEKRYTPRVKGGKHCRACSLSQICWNDKGRRSAAEYIEGMLHQ